MGWSNCCALHLHWCEVENWWQLRCWLILSMAQAAIVAAGGWAQLPAPPRATKLMHTSKVTYYWFCQHSSSQWSCGWADWPEAIPNKACPASETMWFSADHCWSETSLPRLSSAQSLHVAIFYGAGLNTGGTNPFLSMRTSLFVAIVIMCCITLRLWYPCASICARLWVMCSQRIQLAGLILCWQLLFWEIP